MNYKELIKNNQHKLVLTIGYILVAMLSFGVGRLTAVKYAAPEIKVETAAVQPDNYSGNAGGIQSEAQVNTTTTSSAKQNLNCQGKIKGSSSGIYHVPGGAFYEKTTKPVRCFDSEAQAIAAGFRKSSR